MSDHDVYDNPLIARYASRKMARGLWSPQAKFSTWRKLWVALADAQRSLGLKVTGDQVAALRAQVETIDFDLANAYEKRFRHDVMAHIHALGDAAPLARPIIHLGATSCFVTDNADLILIREALGLVRNKTVVAIDALAAFAGKWKDLPCLGFTHFQPAQLVTVGKRASLWCHELTLDLEEIERRLAGLRFLGAKGTTGTQASFLELFDGDDAKVEELDRRVAAAFGFEEIYPVSGQTYSRKIDAQVVATLAGVAESGHRFGTDLRLLAHEREVQEPFEAEQIGSSAMPYKRNPMRAERMCSLGRFALALAPAAGQTAATQWLERTLDDSAIRRLVVPQAFLAVDAILNLYLDVVPGMVVHPAVHRPSRRRTTSVHGDREPADGGRSGRRRPSASARSRIRVHSLAAADQLKEGSTRNDLLDRIQSDPAFPRVDLERILDPGRYIGRSARQGRRFRRARHRADPDPAVSRTGASRTRIPRCASDRRELPSSRNSESRPGVGAG